MVRNVLSLAALATPVLAATLGVVAADGDFKLNSATVRGNATLAEGSVVETLNASSRLNFNSGARVRLDAASRARVHAGRVVIEKGSGEVQAVPGFGLEAHTLRLSAEGARARGRFALTGQRVLQAAADSGSFRVVNAGGVLVTRLEPGLALALEPQQTPGTAAPSSFLGCVLKKDGKWMLYDQTVKLLVELRGQITAVEAEWGNKVQANGTTPNSQPADGRQTMDVTTITRIESGGCAQIAQLVNAEAPARTAAAAAKPPAPAPSTAAATAPATAPASRSGGRPESAGGGGLSAGTKVAIIGAVAGGGAGAALALGGGGGDKRSP